MSLPDESLPSDEQPPHYCQFFEADGERLTLNAVKFIGAGLAAGESAVVIATPQRRESVFAGLRDAGLPAEQALAESRLVFSDAVQTLDEILVSGYPDAARFQTAVGDVIRSLHAAGNGVRAYGEMVGVLWAAGEYPSAIRLEQLWNALRNEVPFPLFCGYPIDIFGEEFQSGTVDALLCAHTHLLPTGRNEDVHNAVRRAMTQVVGPHVIDGKTGRRTAFASAWTDVPRGENLILWVRANLPESAREILSLARHYYLESASAAF